MFFKHLKKAYDNTLKSTGQGRKKSKGAFYTPVQ